jgi:hypothetical protein
MGSGFLKVKARKRSKRGRAYGNYKPMETIVIILILSIWVLRHSPDASPSNFS